LSRDNSDTRRHILSAVEGMLEKNHSSRDIRISSVAQHACVSVQTIYYYFDSLAHLIAQAQLAQYVRIAEPLHQFLVNAELAILNSDETTFWKSIGDDLMLAWSIGQEADGWHTSTLLFDIWSDDKTRCEFRKQVDVQIQRWMSVVELGKARGWIDSEIDSGALISVCWAAVNGQSIFAFSSRMECSPESARDFLLRASMSIGGFANENH